MEWELYAFVCCVRHLSPYFLEKQFIVRTDHKNLVYLAHSTAPKLARWLIIPSEFKYLIENISGTLNVVADGLTRVRWIEKRRPYDSKHHILQRFHRRAKLDGEDLLDDEDEGYVEDEDED